MLRRAEWDPSASIGLVRSSVVALFVLSLGFLVAPTRAEDQPAAAPAGEPVPFPVQVNEAVDRAAAQLVGKQAEDGSWNKEDKVHPIGRTALCTYALLHAGYSPEDEPVRRALTFLGVADGYATPVMPRSTYEAGCLILMLHAVGPSQSGNIKRIADWLVENFNASAGLWGYPDGIPDLSNTQYAALGLKVASLHGHKAPDSIWERVSATTLSMQAECGAFRYRKADMYRASMTHAALLTLRFAYECMETRPEKKTRAAMKRGHDWVAETFRVDGMPFGRGWTESHYHYYMYGLERYAVIFDLDEVGGRDWYREGAEHLLATRKKDWSWGRLENTAFGILFLRKVALTQPTSHARSEKADDAKFPEVRNPSPAADVPFFSQWLVAGPFLGKPGEDDSLFEDHVNVQRAKPMPGVKAGKARWERLGTEEPRLDLGGRPWCSWYCAVWIVSDVERDAVLWLGSNDGARAWFNGEPLVDMHHHGTSADHEYHPPVKLASGRNLLILQVENLSYGSHVVGRISTPDGKPLPPGVKVTADPRR